MHASGMNSRSLLLRASLASLHFCQRLGSRCCCARFCAIRQPSALVQNRHHEAQPTRCRYRFPIGCETVSQSRLLPSVAQAKFCITEDVFTTVVSSRKPKITSSYVKSPATTLRDINPGIPQGSSLVHHDSSLCGGR